MKRFKVQSMRRLTAVLALRGHSVRSFARLCGRSIGHVRFVLLGERVPGEELRDILRDALTAEEWRFVRSETNTLTVPPSFDEKVI